MGLPLYYLDMLCHKPDRTTVYEQEFYVELNDIFMRDKSVYIFKSREEAEEYIRSIQG